MGANLKEVRERIRSVISTQQITKAMKMVSAAKLRKAQQGITQMRPYADKQNSMLVNILSNLDGSSDTVFGQHRTVENVCLVVITSNRGLCGAFNTNIIKSAVETLNTKYEAQLKAGKVTIVCIGKRGLEAMRRRYDNQCKIVADYVDLSIGMSFDTVAPIAQKLMNEFATKKYDAVEISYGRFKNAAMQFPETERLLPVAKLEQKEGGAQKKADYAFEPDQATLLETLVPSILQTQFYKCLLDTLASEHGARMTAMDKATENANDLLKELRINYNKARQEAITKELSEIVGGAAALAG